MKLHIDFEVFSEIDIREAPLDVYVKDPSTRIILAAYAFDDGPVKVWEADQGPCRELRDGLLDSSNTVVAWNTGYERSVLAGKGMVIPLERWLDPMVHARYAGLPGRLKDCAKIPMLGIPETEKTKSETLLINRFCKPGGCKKCPKVCTKENHPDDWRLLVDYCRKDVLTMRHVYNWLNDRFPFPERERQIWHLDQRINSRGLPVDRDLARNGSREVSRLVAEAQRELKELTKLENPNSVNQLTPWLKERGYQHDSIGKDLLTRAVAGSEASDPDTSELV